MKRSILLFPVAAILLLLSVSSCRDAGVRDALQRAEALMETNPKAARAVLDSLARATSPRQLGIRNEELGINPADESHADESHAQPVIPNSSFLIPNFPRKGDNALYALLRTQADYKCRVRLTSDSLPLIATNYYGTRRKSQHAALAQYYLGCTYGDMGRDLDAIDALLRATTLFPDTTNKYFANTLFELGLLYLNHHMENHALSFFRRYRNLDACKKDSLNIGYADYYMGEAYLHKGMNTISDSLFQCVIRNSSFPKESRYYIYYELAKMFMYEWHNPNSALHYLNLYKRYYGEDFGSINLLKADILFENKEYDIAYKSYHKALENNPDIYTSCSAYKGLSKVSPLIGNSDSTEFFINRYSTLLDSIYAISRAKEFSEIENNHVIELHDQQLKARHSRFLLWGGLFFVVAFSVFAIALLLNDRKHKTERLKFEEELRDIKQRHINQNVKEEEPEMEEENASASEPEKDVRDYQANTSLPPRFSIQQERIALYRKQHHESEWARFFREHQLEIRSRDYISPKDSDRFIAYLHELFADVFLDMVNGNQELTRQDLEYCAMVILGFNTVQMSYCARVTSHSLHNRRYRMKEKLTPEWYILIFGTPK